MGHNPSRNPFKQARLGPREQDALDAYKSRSVWRAFRRLDPEVRIRYFNADDLAWLNRYGPRLDRLAQLSAEPRNDREKHFISVCLGHQAPVSDRERLWLRARAVCQYESSLERAARTDSAESRAAVLETQNQKLKAKVSHLEQFVYRLSTEIRLTAPSPPRALICNVVRATGRFRLTGGGGPDREPEFHARPCS